MLAANITRIPIGFLSHARSAKCPTKAPANTNPTMYPKLALVVIAQNSVADPCQGNGRARLRRLPRRLLLVNENTGPRRCNVPR